jgi:hypothetical protein
MKRTLLVTALIFVSLLLVASGVMAMPSATIVKGENSVDLMAAGLRGTVSYGILAQTATNENLAIGFAAAKLPKIGAATDSAAIGAYVNYELYETDGDFPSVSAILGLGFLNSEGTSTTLPVGGFIASQEMDGGLSFNALFAPGFGTASGRWAVAAEIDYKLDEFLNQSGYSLQLGYTYIGGLSAGSVGGFYGGLAFEF